MQAVSAAFVALGVGFAAVQYKRARRHERMRWLGELYTKFYEQPNFNEARDKLVPEEGKPVTPVADLFQDANVTNFMNRLGFIAYMVKKNELDWKDAESLFDYWLRAVNHYPGLKAALEELYGFGALDWLLREHYSD